MPRTSAVNDTSSLTFIISLGLYCNCKRARADTTEAWLQYGPLTPHTSRDHELQNGRSSDQSTILGKIKRSRMILADQDS